MGDALVGDVVDFSDLVGASSRPGFVAPAAPAELDVASGPLVVLTRPSPGRPLDNVYLEADATETETHTATNTITDNPVESGIGVTDASRAEPRRLTAECIFSNTPITPDQQTRAVSSGGFKFNTTAAGEVKIGQVNGYASQARAKMDSLRGQVLKVVTSIRTYKTMMIESISEVRNAKNADAFVFSVAFKEVRIVENKLTRSRKSNDVSHGATKHQGEKPTLPAEETSKLEQGLEAGEKGNGFGDKAAKFVGGIAGF